MTETTASCYAAVKYLTWQRSAKELVADIASLADKEKNMAR